MRRHGCLDGEWYGYPEYFIANEYKGPSLFKLLVYTPGMEATAMNMQQTTGNRQGDGRQHFESVGPDGPQTCALGAGT